MTRVLIVNGEGTARRDVGAFLSLPRFEVVEAASASEAARELASREFDVVLTAARLPEGDAVETLTAVRGEDCAPPVLVIAGAHDAPFDSAAPPAGFELLTKPLRPEPVRAAIDRAADSARLRRENDSLREELSALRETRERPVAGGNGNGHGEASPSNGNGNGQGNGHALQEWIATLPESFDLRSLQADVEREIVKRALASSAGVAAQAARKLGLSRSDLAYKLRRLGIVREPR